MSRESIELFFTCLPVMSFVPASAASTAAAGPPAARNSAAPAIAVAGRGARMRNGSRSLIASSRCRRGT
jgi:hypothetical protein